MLVHEVPMAVLKQSDRVRDIVIRHYVSPALEAGSAKLSIRAGDVLKYAEATDGFPRGRTPLVCNVLQSKKLLDEAGLEIESVDGPPSRQSRKVVVHYRFADAKRAQTNLAEVETPAERAHRLTEKLRGLMKDEIAAHGGAEAFIRWVRSDEDAA
jgi:hypothetical protein